MTGFTDNLSIGREQTSTADREQFGQRETEITAILTTTMFNFICSGSKGEQLRRESTAPASSSLPAQSSSSPWQARPCNVDRSSDTIIFVRKHSTKDYTYSKKSDQFHAESRRIKPVHTRAVGMAGYTWKGASTSTIIMDSGTWQFTIFREGEGITQVLQ